MRNIFPVDLLKVKDVYDDYLQSVQISFIVYSIIQLKMNLQMIPCHSQGILVMKVARFRNPVNFHEFVDLYPQSPSHEARNYAINITNLCHLF